MVAVAIGKGKFFGRSGRVAAGRGVAKGGCGGGGSKEARGTNGRG